jgi:hypothetical protein
MVFISSKNDRHLRELPTTESNEKEIWLDVALDGTLMYLAFVGHFIFTIVGGPPLCAMQPVEDKVEDFPYLLDALIPIIFVSCFSMVYLGLVVWCFHFLKSVCERHLTFSQNLLVAFREGDTEALKIDELALFFFICFAFNFLSCLCTYRYFYNSYGTVNPGWTAVFG